MNFREFARKRLVYVLLGLIMLVHVGLTVHSARIHSFATDEVAHYGAAVSHYKLGNYDYYRVNPPLFRLIGLKFVNLDDIDFDFSQYSQKSGDRHEFAVGSSLVNENFDRAFEHIKIARYCMIPFSLIAAFVIFIWAMQLAGPLAGLMAATLWCFSPTVLGHTPLLSPDVPGAALGVTACYFFWRWLKRPNISTCILFGVFFGLSLALKFTWLVFIFIFPLIWVESRARLKLGKRIGVEFGQIFAAYVLALLVINMSYGFENSLKPLGEFEFVSKTFAGEMAFSQGVSGNRFNDTLLASLPVPAPANMILGIDNQKADFDRGIRSYFLGEWKESGWVHYYVTGMLLKMPIGTWILFILALIWTLTRSYHKLNKEDNMLVILPAVLIIFFVSIQIGFNHHFRYVLSALPFIFIFISRTIATESFDPKPWSGKKCYFWNAAVAGSLIWASVSTLSIYPHTMSYFNEAVGGPQNGDKYFVDSNIDWGQDLLSLRTWVKNHPEATPLYIAYFGNVDPSAVGLEYKTPVGQKLQPGWYAISVNFTRGLTFTVYNGKGEKVFLPSNYLSFFSEIKPDYRVGYSIRIYHLNPNEVEKINVAMENGDGPALKRF